MLVQERLIARVREVCTADDRLDAALMYGSFAAGVGDAYSDIEFWLFFEPRWLGLVEPREWCSRVAPVLHLLRNEFGTDVVIFPGLVRGEFHFASADDIPSVRDWPARGAPVDAMVVVDRSGRLRPVLEATPEHPTLPRTGDDAADLCGRLANWLLLAYHVAARGETLRAWDALGHAHRHLLWLARLVHGATAHWLTPSRGAEAELPAVVVAELRASTAPAEADALRGALGAAWRQGRGYWIELGARHGFAVPDGLFAELDATLQDA